MRARFLPINKMAIHICMYCCFYECENLEEAGNSLAVINERLPKLLQRILKDQSGERFYVTKKKLNRVTDQQ